VSVGLVIVSHSEKIAEGVVELAAQMAPDVVLVAAGGVEDGSGRSRIGTSFDRVQTGIGRASGSEGVVILTDLGSAVMTAETVLEFLDPEVRATVRLARAALVEGAVAAAVQAQGGSGLESVLRAAEEAVVSIRPEDLDPSGPDRGTAPGSAAPAAEGHGGASSGTPTARGSWTLSNRTGLHARPAAVLASGLAGFDAEVTVNGVDGKSVMLLMTLGLRQGRTLTAEASGPEARAAVDFVGESVQSRFGEPD